MTSWTSSVSPIPGFPAYTGPYSVGTIDVEIPAVDLLSPSLPTTVRSKVPSTVAFRCFYPCQQPTQSSRPVLWLPQPQKENLHAFYSDFLNASPSMSTFFQWMSKLLLYTTIPAIRNAPLLQAPHSSKRWPVLVFSHGLAGSRNSYSHICGSLASHGIVVIAPDHRDGSSPLQYVRATPGIEAHTVRYRNVAHTATSDVYRARDDQLQVRLAELSLVYEALLKIDRGDEVSNLDPNDNTAKKQKNETNSSSNGLLSMFRGVLDIHRPGKITWAGHSFGGATIVQLLKSVFYSSASSRSPLLLFQPSRELKLQITPDTPAMLLDPWGLPLNSPSSTDLAKEPLPCFAPNGPGGGAVLTIMSEHFFNWRSNLLDIKKALHDPARTSVDRPEARIFYPLRSAHLSQSDYGILFPSLTKYLAKAVEPERTMRLNVRAILEVMRRVGISVADTSAKDMEVDKSEPTDSRSDSEKNMYSDWRILSDKEGMVNGWVASSADQDIVVEMAKLEKSKSISDERDGKQQTEGNQPNEEHRAPETGSKQPANQPTKKRTRWWLSRRASEKQDAEVLGKPDAQLGGTPTSAAAEGIST